MGRFLSPDGKVPEHVLNDWNVQADMMRFNFGATDEAALLAGTTLASKSVEITPIVIEPELHTEQQD